MNESAGEESRKREAGSSRKLSELPIRTNFATFRVNHEHKNTASGDADG
jgi:hypothetical protein